jgi:2,3-diketo-5-methylthio-1-phosphopentane phosphatase
MENNKSETSIIAVLCDFDGTVTSQNVLNTLYSNFSSSYRELIERWEKGEISTIDEIEGAFATVTADRFEMETLLNRIQIDEGFFSLYNHCKNCGYYLAIISDGLRWYIDYILDHNGIKGIDIYANEIHFTEDGIEFSYPWFEPSTPLRGTSKRSIVESYQSKGYQVVFIGDGQSDIEVVGQADFLFASDYLLKYAQKQGIDVYEFNCLEDMLAQLVKVFSNNEK